MMRQHPLLDIVIVLILTGFLLITIFVISADASGRGITTTQVYTPYPMTRTLDITPCTTNLKEVTANALRKTN